MKKLSYLVAGVVALFFASCATNQVVSYTTSLGADNYVVDVTPMVATLQVEDTHVDGEFQWEGKKRAYVNYDELRDNAIYAALQKRQADVLVAPQYQFVTEIRASRKYIKVFVTGYPAKYVNFEAAPKPSALEVQEMKDNSNYVLVTKDTKGAVCGYQIVVPYEKDMKVLDLDETTVEKIVLNGNKAKIGRKKAPKPQAPAGQQDVFGKIADKFQGNKPARK